MQQFIDVFQGVVSKWLIDTLACEHLYNYAGKVA